MKIDLILLGVEVQDQDIAWPWGKILTIPYTIDGVIEVARSIDGNDGHLLFLDSTLPVPHQSELERLVESKVDISHAGLMLGTYAITEFLDYVAPISYFNLDQSKEIELTSWKVSLKCCLVKKEIFQFPFLDSGFESLDCAALEWGFRLIWQGASIRYTPGLLKTANGNGAIIPHCDGLRFIHNYYGKKWLMWIKLRFVFKKLTLNPFGASFPKRTVIDRTATRNYSLWRNHSLVGDDSKVSIIIPTVDRYPYLFTLLKQLSKQSILPYEVIVIDQTAPDRRQSINISDYELIGLKLIYQETSGQCSSRNEGLRQSKGNYILFLDDDDEVKPDLIEQHLKCLSYFKADVSCGVCDEVGAGPIPKEYNLIRMSDVFPTNNGMLRREVLFRSGLFDLTFNRGQKADGDLGARIYKSGARMILNPEIRVLHHRAPMGGLRKHKVRKVTYSSSRRNITHFRLPHLTELYFNHRHFTERQHMEHMWLTMLGTFSIRGGWFKKLLKPIWATINFPLNLYKIINRDRKARTLIGNNSSIPELAK